MSLSEDWGNYSYSWRCFLKYRFKAATSVSFSGELAYMYNTLKGSCLSDGFNIFFLLLIISDILCWVFFNFYYFQTGFLAACPYLLKAILGPLGGVTADALIRYKICKIVTVRKIFYAAGKTKHNVKQY